MKISEMIAQLEELKENHGDLPVVHLSERYRDGASPYILSKSDMSIEKNIEYYLCRGITKVSDCLAIGLHR